MGVFYAIAPDLRPFCHAADCAERKKAALTDGTDLTEPRRAALLY